MLKINSVVCGDSREEIQNIEDNSVQLTLTSPPYYKQREYDAAGIGQEDTVFKYILELCAVFDAVIRATKENGIIIVNLGDKTINGSLQLVPHKFAQMVLETTELKLINVVEWIKSNPNPMPTARTLTSAHEPFFVFAKSKNYKFNIDCYMQEEIVKKPFSETMGKKYFSLIMNSELTPIEKANAVDDVLKTIEQIKSGEITEFRMKIRGIHKLPYGGQAGGRLNQINNNGYTIIKMYGKKMKKDWVECAVSTPKIGEIHPAVYPEQMISEFIKLYTDVGDLVLDPFAGSGVSPVAAKKLGRNYIAIDTSQQYCDYMENVLSGF